MGESAGGGGNQEGVKAIAGIVELLRRCLAGSHNAGSLRKKEEKKKNTGSGTVQQIYRSKNLGR